MRDPSTGQEGEGIAFIHSFGRIRPFSLPCAATSFTPFPLSLALAVTALCAFCVTRSTRASTKRENVRVKKVGF